MLIIARNQPKPTEDFFQKVIVLSQKQPADGLTFVHGWAQWAALVLVLETNRIIPLAKVKGLPDLLVEIISPPSEENDRVLKRSRYEMFGVPEYWLVDPFDHQLTKLVLVDGRYQELPHDDHVFL